MVLKALQRGALHGYGVAEFIHRSSNDVLKVEEGALYPALHRLEHHGWIDDLLGPLPHPVREALQGNLDTLKITLSEGKSA